jgi:hypothetical protein
MASRDVRPPAAFLSYARFNDKQDHERITTIRRKLSGEMQTVTGKAFEIFQDRDLRAGEEWKTRIEQSIESATLLIAILTPAFFNSEYCRKETNQFLALEARLGRRDLIIPIYYVPVDALEEDQQDGDTLIELMKARQRFDGLELRFLEMDSTAMRRAVNQLAVQIKSALKRFPAAVAAPARTADDGACAGGADRSNNSTADGRSTRTAHAGRGCVARSLQGGGRCDRCRSISRSHHRPFRDL